VSFIGNPPLKKSTSPKSLLVPTLFYFIQHRIIYNKMVGYLSIFLPDPFWSLGFGDWKLFGALNLVFGFFLFGGFDAYLFGQADQISDRSGGFPECFSISHFQVPLE